MKKLILFLAALALVFPSLSQVVEGPELKIHNIEGYIYSHGSTGNATADSTLFFSVDNTTIQDEDLSNANVFTLNSGTVREIPDPAGRSGRIIFIKNGAGVNVTLGETSTNTMWADTLEGGGTIAPGELLMLVSDGEYWYARSPQTFASVKTDSITSRTNNAHLKLVGQGTGLVEIEGAYTLPGVDGTNGQALITDGSGVVSFGDVSSVTFGTDNQVPFVNLAGDDFQYSSNLTFDGGQLDVDNININGSTVQNFTSGAMYVEQTEFDGPNITMNSNSVISNMGDVIFQTGATGGTIQTGTSNADKWQLQAYDVDGSAHQTVASAHAGNTPLFHLFSNSLRFTDATDNTKRASFDLSGITTGTTRAFTFPDQAGTFALTSDLSSYVPYTGATTNVNLGSNSLTAAAGSFTTISATGNIQSSATIQADTYRDLTGNQVIVSRNNTTNIIRIGSGLAVDEINFYAGGSLRGSISTFGAWSTNGGSLTAGAGSFSGNVSLTNNLDGIAQYSVSNNNAGISSLARLLTTSDVNETQIITHSSGRTATRYGITVANYGELLTSSVAGLLIGTTGAGQIVFGTNSLNRGSISSSGAWSTNGNSLTSGAITSTALTGTGTRLMNVTSGGAHGAITNGTDGQVMTMVSGSPAWSSSSSFSEGTFTPTLVSSGGGESVTYAYQSGYYIRAGNQVTVWISISPSSVSGGSGSAQIGGLPENMATFGSGRPDFVGTVVGNGLDLSAGYTQLLCRGQSTGATTFNLLETGDSVSAQSLPFSAISNNDGIEITFTYVTD